MNPILLSADSGGSLDTLVEVVTQIWTWFTDMAGDLLTTPLFLIPLGIFVIGGAIGLVKRII